MFQNRKFQKLIVGIIAGVMILTMVLSTIAYAL